MIAFEPHAKLSEFLKKATPKNVTVINKCLSDKEEIVDFHIPLIEGKVSYNISSLEVDMVNQYETQIQKVESVKLDNYNFEKVGFIKIDVEGHELNVLKGALKTIQASRPVLQVEILEDPSYVNDHEVTKLLRELDYEILCLKNNILSLFTPVKSKKISRNYIFLPKG